MTTIQKRKYVDRQNKRFMPTELGKAVVKMLVENLSDIINVSFTAKMENDLDKIALGEEDRDKVLLTFYKKFREDLDKFAQLNGGAKATKFSETEFLCPKCQKNKLLMRLARTGEFLACAGFPACNFTASFERDEDNNIKMIEKPQPVEIDKDCPKCGKKLVEKVGRFGKFVACPGYPDCKFIQKDFKKSFPKKEKVADEKDDSSESGKPAKKVARKKKSI
jgi:DNA topoisomerase-1